MVNTEPVSSTLHQEENGSGAAALKGSKDSNNKKREEPKAGPKKPKEKVDAISQFDLNNYASRCRGLEAFIPEKVHGGFYSVFVCLSLCSSITGCNYFHWFYS